MASLQQSHVFNEALGRLGARADLCPVSGAYILRRRCRPALVSRAALQSAEHAAALARAGVRLINAEREADAQALRVSGFLRIMTPQHIAELQLHASDTLQLAQMQGKWRNRLRRAEAQLSKRHSLIHRPFCPFRDNWLLGAESAQQKARRYRGYPPTLCLALHQAAPSSLHLFTLMHQQSPLAAMLFVAHGQTATYHIGWSGPEGRAAGAHPLILWHAMRALQREGIKLLDLGGVETETSAALARFKLGSGACARPLGGTWARLLPQRKT